MEYLHCKNKKKKKSTKSFSPDKILEKKSALLQSGQPKISHRSMPSATVSLALTNL
jgi:hypothetical protein